MKNLVLAFFLVTLAVVPYAETAWADTRSVEEEKRQILFEALLYGGTPPPKKAQEQNKETPNAKTSAPLSFPVPPLPPGWKGSMPKASSPPSSSAASARYNASVASGSAAIPLPAATSIPGPATANTPPPVPFVPAPLPTVSAPTSTPLPSPTAKRSIPAEQFSLPAQQAQPIGGTAPASSPVIYVAPPPERQNIPQENSPQSVSAPVPAPAAPSVVAPVSSPPPDVAVETSSIPRPIPRPPVPERRNLPAVESARAAPQPSAASKPRPIASYRRLPQEYPAPARAPVTVAPVEATYGDIPRRAKQGDADAEYQMGMWSSRNATNSATASEQAYRWFTQAASNGHPRAQYNLGVMYAQGDGIVQNLSEAYIWFNLASAQQMEGAAQARDMVAASLTPEALMKAQERATLYHQRISQNASMKTGDIAGITSVP